MISFKVSRFMTQYQPKYSTVTNVNLFLFSSFPTNTIVEHVDIDEAKSIFESNYSHVYFILYDTFVQAETNLRQRGKPFLI